MMPITSAVEGTSKVKYKKLRPARLKRNAENNRRAEPSPDDLYKILVMAAEGYVNLKQM